MRNKTTNIYTEWKPLIDALTNDEAGLLLKSILKYQNGEEVENINPVWIFIKSKIDEYNGNLKNISKARSEAGKKGMKNRWNGITNDNKDNKCYQMLSNDNKNNNKIKENKTKQNKIKENENYFSEQEKNYAFNGEIIKLNQKDFDNWTNKFQYIQDLTFELEQLDLYLQRKPENAKGWFFYVQQLLLKKNKELEPLPYNPRL